MGALSSEWKDRIEHWIRTLRMDLYRPLEEIQWKGFVTRERLSRVDALRRASAEVSAGMRWGKPWEYLWLKGEVVLSEAAEGKPVVVDLCAGGEATVFVRGKPFGTYRADWVEEEHHFLEDNVLTFRGKSGERFPVELEVYAGHYFPDATRGKCATGPVLPGSFQEPEEDAERRILGRCTWGIWNETAYQLYMDVMTLQRLLPCLEEKSLRAARIREGLRAFTLTVDFEQRLEERQICYEKGREILRPLLEAVNGTTAPVFYAVGNAHLDLAWLWPQDETIRKTARTFAAQLRLLAQYPEYVYVQSQPALYEMCREQYPDLFEQIRKAAREGRWIAEGAMWVEPDTNLSGGEALIRQLLYGRQYFREVFHTESRVLWLPDSFGYSGALPQLLKGFDVPYLVTQKIFWSYNEGETFPYHYFRWKGIDGSEVTSFLPTDYTYRTDPGTLHEVWNSRRQTEDLDAFLLPYGYGDGGGGPSRDYLEYARREVDLEGCPRVKMAGPVEFFREMEQSGGPLHTYVGELYFNAHRGTYTSQARVKKYNRRAETALREMELWCSLAAIRGKYKALPENFAQIWKRLLKNQFHDILPGSGIGRIHEEACEELAGVIREASHETKSALTALLEENGSEEHGEKELVRRDEAITVFNSLGNERTCFVALPDRFASGAMLENGEKVPLETGPDGVRALVRVPSVGAITLLPVPKQEPGRVEKDPVKMCAQTENAAWARAYEAENCFVLENDQILCKVDFAGQVISFVRKEDSCEFAAGPMNEWMLFKDVPRKFDAWDIDSNYILQRIPDGGERRCRLKAEGLTAQVEVEGKIGNSQFSQQIRLAAGSSRLEFKTELDWKELHRLLKVRFPVTVHAEEGTNEIQFGWVRRPTHRSRPFDQDRFEVCNHRYTALAEENRGAALLNDCKYGISMNGQAMELTLAQAGASPQMRADNGHHSFTYAFTAWSGSFFASDVVWQGYELNTPVQILPGAAGTFSFAQVSEPNIVLETIKPAEEENGGWIIRLYESKRTACRAQLTLDMRIREAYETNLEERNLRRLCVVDGNRIDLQFRAFEIKTMRIFFASLT